MHDVHHIFLYEIPLLIPHLLLQKQSGSFKGELGVLRGEWCIGVSNTHFDYGNIGTNNWGYNNLWGLSDNGD